VEEVKEPDTKRLKVSELKERNQSMEIEKPDEDISNLNHLQCKVRDLESQVADLKRKLEEKERFIKEL
jgi:peptidoglycan hydrolase CwlO-like protein